MPTYHHHQHKPEPKPTAWAAATPFDVIKSVIQGSSITTPAAENRISAVAARLYKAEVCMSVSQSVSQSVNSGRVGCVERGSIDQIKVAVHWPSTYFNIQPRFNSIFRG